MIRECTEADVDWLLRIARLSYKGRMTNVQGAKEWTRKAILGDSQNVFIWRGKKAAVIGMAVVPFFQDDVLASIQFFAGKEDELVELFKHALNWAKNVGAKDGLRFRSSTGFDISSLVKKLGAESESPSYLMRF